MKPDWVDEELAEAPPLTTKQIQRLTRMTEVLRENPINIEYVAEIKTLIGLGKDWDAKTLWEEFTEEEQHALWVAPKFGGIFTTEERKALKGSE